MQHTDWRGLPFDVYHLIFDYCSVFGIRAISCSFKRLYSHCDDDFWIDKCLRDFGTKTYVKAHPRAYLNYLRARVIWSEAEIPRLTQIILPFVHETLSAPLAWIKNALEEPSETIFVALNIYLTNQHQEQLPFGKKKNNIRLFTEFLTRSEKELIQLEQLTNEVDKISLFLAHKVQLAHPKDFNLVFLKSPSRERNIYGRWVPPEPHTLAYWLQSYCLKEIEDPSLQKYLIETLAREEEADLNDLIFIDGKVFFATNLLGKVKAMGVYSPYYHWNNPWYITGPAAYLREPLKYGPAALIKFCRHFGLNEMALAWLFNIDYYLIRVAQNKLVVAEENAEITEDSGVKPSLDSSVDLYLNLLASAEERQARQKVIRRLRL